MKNKKLYAAILAATMLISTIVLAVSAYAEENIGDTMLKLTVEEKNQYVMRIPATTTMNMDGAATALVNGLNVKGTNMTKDVVVTITGANNWKMVTVGKATTIGYAVYDKDACAEEDKITMVEFSVAELEANSMGGVNRTLYVKPNATDLAQAEAGEYEGTITFTAELKEKTVSIADALMEGAQYKLKLRLANTGREYDYSFEKTASGFDVVKILENDNDVTNAYKSACSSGLDNQKIVFQFDDDLIFILNISTGKYELTGGMAGVSSVTGFSVKPLGATEFTEVSITAEN